MFTKILVAVDPALDGREEHSLHSARKLAHDSYAEITALMVLEPAPSHWSEDYSHEAKVAAADRVVTSLRHQIGEGSEIHPFVRHGHAAHEIINHAKENDIDCIIVASHQPGVSDYFLGSTAARVVRHAPCTVIVLR